MTRSKHLGSTFDSFLEERGLRESVDVAAAKRVIVDDLVREMTARHVSRAELARRIQTSRSGVHRLLDPRNTSLTLASVVRAFAAVGVNFADRLTMNVAGASTTRRNEKPKTRRTHGEPERRPRRASARRRAHA